MKRGCFVLIVAAVLCIVLALRSCGHHEPHAQRGRGHTAKPAVALSPSTPSQPPVVVGTQVQAEDLQTCITAVAAQSDPSKLATLGSRQTNPRLKRIMYYLAQARAGGADPGDVIDRAQQINGSFGTARAPLVKASLLRNLKICDGLAMLTPENMARLKRGNAPVVTRGPYTGQIAEVDHIVPRAHSSEPPLFPLRISSAPV